MNVPIDTTHIFGGHMIQLLQSINTLVAIKPNIATKCVLLPKNGAIRVNS
jgi:hypothetical protein